jgi:mannose-6-phosphate isomerase-like protein (cupin superfamily)
VVPAFPAGTTFARHIFTMNQLVMLFVLLAAVPSAERATPVDRVSSVDIRVTDRSGAPVSAAHVVVGGESDREGATNAYGRVTFQNVKPGTYVLRVERSGFIALEKEFTVGGLRATSVVAALSPVGRPLAVARPTPPAGKRARERQAAPPPEEPKTFSIPDLAEKQLIGRESIKESPIGCTGESEARLVQVNDPLNAHARDDADEMLYVVAGEGVLTIGGSEQRIAPGWLSMIPRGTPYSLSRKGRKPVILLSLLSGQPCSREAL